MRQVARRGGLNIGPNGCEGIACETTSQASVAEIATAVAQRHSALGEMTGGIAHDLRNILAVIDSGLQLAERNLEDLQAALAYIAGAREGVARGVMLISQLLAFAKQRELEARAADANAMLKTLELFLRYGAGPKVRLILELSPGIPDCLIEPVGFNSAILNLVLNARDAMPTGGEIRISTAPWTIQSAESDVVPGPYVRIRVLDNGQGMSDDVVRSIFEPFFTTKGDQGTGLGIPQVRAAMCRVGGHICVTSDVGQGTAFDLFFPAKELPAPGLGSHPTFLEKEWSRASTNW